jgi:hypothetical protein
MEAKSLRGLLTLIIQAKEFFCEFKFKLIMNVQKNGSAKCCVEFVSYGSI